MAPTHPENNLVDFIEVENSIYTQLNATSVEYPKIPLHELIADRAQISTLKRAIEYNGIEISYIELDQKANQVAHYFIVQGVAKGDCIAVALPRSIELVVTLVAILKCGAAYLPLDPNFPNDRLSFMMEDSEAKYVLTTTALSSLFNTNASILLVEEVLSSVLMYPTSSPKVSVAIDALAYIMYTSGSTGKPKGVMVTHKNVVNFLCSMRVEPGISEHDRLLSITTISFDIAVLELFLPLVNGATLILANNKAVKDSRLLLELLKKEEITILQATPTTWQMLLDAQWNERLPIKALCGGEALPMGLAKKILSKVNELWNVYGPTETTIWSAIKQVKKGDDEITIGRPIANTQLYILNAENEMAAPNTIGELCIAGDGVSKGYWKRKALTEEKFIKNRFDTEFNPVLYRTGDLGKLLPTGEIQCLGRIDHQVKIRGHRIELGEIEEFINTFETIDHTVVVVKNGILIATIVATQLKSLTETTLTDWKNRLAQRLPTYMIPQRFHLLEAFPTTLNRKIDRKALLNLTVEHQISSDFQAPKTPSEQMISKVWQTCLEIDKIDIHSNFFELGGHSLVALEAVTLIEKQTGRGLPLAAFLEHPTIHTLSLYLDENQISWDSLVPLQPEGNKVPIFIVHGANYNVLIFKNLSNLLDKDQPVYALQARGLDGKSEPHSSVEEMASHYISEIMIVNPEGPYVLAGFSFGGIIAFEMAKQLKAKGKKVKHIILFDSYVYPSLYYSNPLVKTIVSKCYTLIHSIFIVFNMFSSIQDFKRRYDAIKNKVSGIYLRLKYGRKKQYHIQFRYTPIIDKKHQLAFNNYHLIPQEVSVELFRASKNIFYAHDFDLLGWKKIALKGVRKHMLVGNHSEIFLKPSVEDFAKKLQYILDKPD